MFYDLMVIDIQITSRKKGRSLSLNLAVLSAPDQAIVNTSLLPGPIISHVLITNLRTNMKYMLFILWVSETVPEW